MTIDDERAAFEAVMANHGYENSGWYLPIPVRCPAGYKPLEYVVGWAMWQAGRAALRAEGAPKVGVLLAKQEVERP